MHRAIEKCRVCGNKRLEPIIDLGVQELTGVFPATPSQRVSSGPLRLVRCSGPRTCGLVQLQHSYAMEEMYGNNYGYRSGINASMVSHLHGKVKRILSRIDLGPGAVVLDIGSNDGTTLRGYPSGNITKVGIDPTAAKFRQYYPPDVTVVADFFSERRYRQSVGEKQASVVTAFSMFYDLEAPVEFMREVHRILASDGIWVFEQSYLPLMIDRNSYDTICHEHLEYYSVSVINWMAREAGFKIVELEFNDVNGGSFSVTVARNESPYPESPLVQETLAREEAAGLNDMATYAAFATRVEQSRTALLGFIDEARRSGKTVAALGASTKGNVLLQYCGLTPDHITAIGEVNEDKFGSFTPGTHIPILRESDVLDSEPDYLLVLPWHFRDTFVRKTLKGKSRLVFPLPTLEVV